MSGEQRPSWRKMPSDQRDALLTRLCSEGKTAFQIAEYFDGSPSRSAIIGRVHRLKEKGAKIRLAGAFRGGPRNGSWGEPKPARKVERLWTSMSAAEKNEAVKAGLDAGMTHAEIAATNGTAAGNIGTVVARLRRAGDVEGKAVSATPRRLHRKKPEIERAVVPTADVEAWLAQNGGARKFVSGTTTDLDHIRAYLRPKGIEVTYRNVRGGSYHVKKPAARPAQLDRAGFFRMLDDLRVADGLEPFSPTHQPPKEVRHGAHY